MKHLNTYKIFESDDYKDPIDVESDVNEFLEKLGDKFKVWCSKVTFDGQYYNKKLDELNHLSSSNPTMTDLWDVYEIYNTDDYGRKMGGPIVLVKAVSKLHARIKASTIKNNLELFTTGFYDAIKISKSEYEAKIENLEKELQKLKDIK